MKRLSLTLLFGAVACTHHVPAHGASDPNKLPYAKLVELAVQEIPWDSLCIVAQHRSCSVVRIDSVIYAARLAVINPKGDPVAEKLSEPPPASHRGRPRFILSAFTRELARPDTAEISFAVSRALSEERPELLASLALPQDSTGYYIHFEFQQVGSAWTLLRRWLIEG